MSRKVYIENMPLEKAQQLFINQLEQVGYFNLTGETIPVLDSQGRVSLHPVIAKRSSPHYIASAMDGIAVKADVTFTATETNPITLAKEQYLEVDTGDYIPPQYDSVIMIEDVNYIENSVQIIKAAVPWQHIRSVGEDLVTGDMVMTSLQTIGPYEIAALLNAAITDIEVVKKPVVAIIPTGTELVEYGNPEMAPGEIVESNSHMLSGLCLEWGAVPWRQNIVIDDREAIKQAVLSVKDQADFIVVCSGSSAGREDYTSSIVEELGELIVHGIATRPGKPAILGIIDNKPLIGVPGYPISAQLVFSLFAKPVLLKKQAIDLPEPETITAQMSRKIASSMGVDEFINVNLAYMEGKYLAYPLNRGAGITTSLVKADGITVIPRGKEGINAGEDCQIKLWRPRKVLDETLVCIGSHDMSIDILADLLYKSYGLRLISSNVGSMGGLMALRRGETHFSGIHLLDYETGKYNISYVNRYLPGQDWCLINLVNRQQGLIVKKGNPLNVQSLQDITRDNIRYINRQKGSGTRLLLDFMLQQQGVDSNSIYGYNREEYTHLAVAAAVKNDAGDVALGIYSSARALDLDFVPLAEESYDLCILPERLGDIRLEQLLSVIQSNEFKKHIDQIGGYNLKSSGQITSQSR